MAYRQFVNSVNPATTLSSGYTSGGTSMSVASVASLPALASFIILVDSEFLLVSAIAGSGPYTLTVAGAQEGSSAANHSSGANVYCIFSAGTLAQVLADHSGIGTYANRPTSTTGARTGMRYKYSDVPAERIFDGSAWRDFLDAYGAALPSDATPISVSGLRVWLSADSLAGLNDGDAVNNWPNLAGGPNISGIAGPVYKTNILNSLPVVRVAAANYFQAVMPEIIGAAELSIFVVAKFSSLSNSYTGIVATVSSGFLWAVKSNGKTAFYDTGGSYDGSGSATLNNSTYYVMTLMIGASGIHTRVALGADYSSASTVFQNNSAGTKGTIGADISTSGRLMTGDIAEVIMYCREVASAERDTIETYLKSKYGL